MRDIRSLTPSDIDHILADAPKRCYTEIAEDLEVGVYTVRRVVRNNRLKRYG